MFTLKVTSTVFSTSYGTLIHRLIKIHPKIKSFKFTANLTLKPIQVVGKQ
jgi:hypothetical protein